MLGGGGRHVREDLIGTRLKPLGMVVAVSYVTVRPGAIVPRLTVLRRLALEPNIENDIFKVVDVAFDDPSLERVTSADSGPPATAWDRASCRPLTCRSATGVGGGALRTNVAARLLLASMCSVAVVATSAKIR